MRAANALLLISSLLLATHPSRGSSSSGHPGPHPRSPGPGPHPRSAELLRLLTATSDWLLDGERSGICLRTNYHCRGYVNGNGSWSTPSCDDWGN